jgi:hypothetical protein
VSAEEPMSIEDRVRAATRAGATLVRDVGPLTAPDRVRPRRRPAPGARRWRTWGIPLAAAAAVVLVALSLVAVRQFGASAPASGRPITNAPTTVPRYYVAVEPKRTEPDGYTGSGALIVGDDHTGQAIATVTPPRSVAFDEVQGASDDRTFVVMATTGMPVETGNSWYLLRIAPGTADPYRLTKLPIKLPSGSPTGVAYALSPDHRELAVESLGDQSSSGFVTTLALYSVSSGAELRAWTAGTFGQGPSQYTLSWLSGGRQLAFSDVPAGADRGAPREDQMRILDVTGSGTDLLAASRALLTVQSPSSSSSGCYSLHITPDGGTVICATQYGFGGRAGGTNAGCGGGGLEFTAYSVRTGKPIRVLYRFLGACHDGISTLQWTNASATEIIGATQINVANEGGKAASQLGVITDGHIRLLTLPKSVSLTYYVIVAF